RRPRPPRAQPCPWSSPIHTSNSAVFVQLPPKFRRTSSHREAWQSTGVQVEFSIGVELGWHAQRVGDVAKRGCFGIAYSNATKTKKGTLYRSFCDFLAYAA